MSQTYKTEEGTLAGMEDLPKWRIDAITSMLSARNACDGVAM